MNAVESMDVRWKHPFTCVVAGPTGSGKSYFVKDFIAHLSHMVTPVPEEVVWCYGEWQPLYEHMPGVVFVEGLPDDMDTWTPKSRLLIIDDLMQEADGRVTKLFTKGSHHRNMSVIYIVQNLFDKNKEHRTISLNAHYLVVFKNPRDASQIVHLAKQMYPGRTRYLQDAFKQATHNPHGYLLIDSTQYTPDHLRLRSNIFSPTSTEVFLPK